MTETSDLVNVTFVVLEIVHGTPSGATWSLQSHQIRSCFDTICPRSLATIVRWHSGNVDLLSNSDRGPNPTKNTYKSLEILRRFPEMHVNDKGRLQCFICQINLSKNSTQQICGTNFSCRNFAIDWNTLRLGTWNWDQKLWKKKVGTVIMILLVISKILFPPSMVDVILSKIEASKNGIRK